MMFQRNQPPMEIARAARLVVVLEWVSINLDFVSELIQMEGEDEVGGGTYCIFMLIKTTHAVNVIVPSAKMELSSVKSACP